MTLQDTIIIPAKAGSKVGKQVVYATGKVFFCILADAEFQIEADTRGKVTSNTGKTFGDPSAKEFKKLTFYNTSAAQITVTFYAGDDAYKTSDVASLTLGTVSVQQAAAAPVEGIFVITQNDTPQQILASSTQSTRMMLLYPASSVAAGILQPNANPIYAGISATYQPDKRAITDIGYPIVLEMPNGKKFAVNLVRANGKVGDGFFYRYWPE